MTKRKEASHGLMDESTQRRFLKVLGSSYREARCTLDFRTPLELLVATILSAQCTDERVNALTPGLFRKYRRPENYAGAPLAKLEADIRPTGFFRNKARAIQKACHMIVEQHGGKVPETMEDLLALPGVARKTASVVLGNAFGVADGIVVDTHVSRVSQRSGLTRNTASDKIERDLMSIVPRSKWIDFGHQMIQHGRRVCQARKPDCPKCPFRDICPSRELFWPSAP